MNNWSEESLKVQHLWVSLTGVALSFLDELPEEQTQRYEDICQAMENWCSPERLSTVYKAELNHRKRRENESLPAEGGAAAKRSRSITLGNTPHALQQGGIPR